MTSKEFRELGALCKLSLQDQLKNKIKIISLFRKLCEEKDLTEERFTNGTNGMVMFSEIIYIIMRGPKAK